MFVRIVTTVNILNKQYEYLLTRSKLNEIDFLWTVELVLKYTIPREGFSK